MSGCEFDGAIRQVGSGVVESQPLHHMGYAWCTASRRNLANKKMFLLADMHAVKPNAYGR